ncbi:hypothetical protein VKS41_007443 [Umbelopsis sp. WA50703]
MRRLDLLKRLTTKAGCKNITPIHGSFLEVDPHDPTYAEVEYLLLDPSCSGSGIISRLDHLVDDEQEDTGTERLDSLAEFQIAVIKHAMKFPKAKKIVYSTCSIHPQENEHVVTTILSSTSEFVLGPRSETIPTWERRGLVKECNDDTDIADCVVRTSPTEDYTNGFFVACFMRKDEENGLKRKAENNETSQKSKKKKKKNKKKSNKQQSAEQQPIVNG